jgi:sigma-B regulation protein RsbU (phosphoserine phosphatase)
MIAAMVDAGFPSSEFDRLPWQERLAQVVAVMQDVSRQTDPQAMATIYGNWVRKIQPVDRFVSVSRRDLIHPWYRITRSSAMSLEINPWTERHKLPLFDRGLLGDLIYGEQPRIINDLRVGRSDPAYDHIGGFGSLQAVTQFEDGKAINMTVVLRHARNGFDPELFPEAVWRANLFGRATKNLVLSKQLHEAWQSLDRELRGVANVYATLMPQRPPDFAGVEFAHHFQSSFYAGGDYFDYLPIDSHRLGLLIADVAGHGAPAAVVMAVTHAIARSSPARDQPAAMLAHLNRRLCDGYTSAGGFVTAFYAVIDTRDASLTFANAGHPAPRVLAGTTIRSIEAAARLPLGILDDEAYEQARFDLRSSQRLVLFTDGITEAHAPGQPLFGVERLDEVVARGHAQPTEACDDIVRSVNAFTGNVPANDDRTLLVADLVA